MCEVRHTRAPYLIQSVLYKFGTESPINLRHDRLKLTYFQLIQAAWLHTWFWPDPREYPFFIRLLLSMINLLSILEMPQHLRRAHGTGQEEVRRRWARSTVFFVVIVYCNWASEIKEGGGE